MNKKVILSGMRPTGSLHLGNYFGALENWVKLQNEYECYFFIADWHALTTGYEDTSDFKNNINDMVIDWLSAGLDPEKCTIFLQSEVSEHAELHLLFSMITPLSWLQRCPTYKDQLTQIKNRDITTYGFLGYPCLMASDILIYKADFVPVGEDQLPHLELAREIARRFNYLYSEVLSEPQPILTEAKVLPGTDGRKMSKSYGNTIALSDDPETMHKKVMSMVTDPARIKKTDPGHPEVCSVYEYHKIFSRNELSQIKEECKGGKIGCVQCKKNLAKKMTQFFQPIYEKRQEIVSKPGLVRDIINAGTQRAQEKAALTLKEVKEAMRIDW